MRRSIKAIWMQWTSWSQRITEGRPLIRSHESRLRGVSQQITEALQKKLHCKDQRDFCHHGQRGISPGDAPEPEIHTPVRRPNAVKNEPEQLLQLRVLRFRLLQTSE